MQTNWVPLSFHKLLKSTFTLKSRRPKSAYRIKKKPKEKLASVACPTRTKIKNASKHPLRCLGAYILLIKEYQRFSFGGLWSFYLRLNQVQTEWQHQNQQNWHFDIISGEWCSRWWGTNDDNGLEHEEFGEISFLMPLIWKLSFKHTGCTRCSICLAPAIQGFCLFWSRRNSHSENPLLYDHFLLQLLQAISTTLIKDTVEL